MTESKDVVAKLLHDHQQVKKMFADIEKASEARIADMFWHLTQELVRHEVAEEEVIYPVVRHAIPNGERLANARIKEQSEAEKLLAKMEKTESDPSRFLKDLARLRDAVLAHAEKEEELIFEPMCEHIDAERRRTLGERYEQAKLAAPTHPHPNVPDTPPANIAIGPVAMLFDKARDAMHKLAS